MSKFLARPSSNFEKSRGSTATRPAISQSRPSTSRPGTSRPQTGTSTRQEASYVIALLESRGVAREVGMAALDKDTGRMVLVQLADCSTYVKTLHQMYTYYPSLILVPDTFMSSADTSKGRHSSATSPFVQYITEEFPDVPIEPVARKCWNDGVGLDFINQLCVEDDEKAATLVAASDKCIYAYYVLSAACALFKHAEGRLNTRFAPCSLRIKYAPVEGTMLIDPETARNLELVNNMTSKKSTQSLFGILNHTYTAMAFRLLRVNILAPITIQSAIDARLDAIEEIVQQESSFSDIRDALKTLNKMDFDKLISSLAASEARPSNSLKLASSRVSQMLNLRNFVRNIPLLQKALSGSQSQLLQAIHDMVSDHRLSTIDSLIRDHLNDETTSAKGGIAAVHARVWAIKANRNHLLDVARETFKENIGDIHQLNTSLSEEHELPLVLVYQESGFVFSLKRDEHEEKLPREFINVAEKRGKILFSTMELKQRNARLQAALNETLNLSDKIIQDLVTDVLEDVAALYKASEAIALVDLLWSFAHTSIIRNYVRPEFTGTLAIKAGHHPILQTSQVAGTLVPNDVYCCDASRFQIVQGPNMSGKSTYLRQIGLLTIMAMCGCFVPAMYASFRLHDSLLTRLSNDDDMEKSLSTFANEMTSSAMILGIATPMSLVLIDELGRGTSPNEGVGISYAIAEELIKIGCFVFFATHFAEVSTMLSRKPAVVNLHLSVQKTRPTTSNFGIVYQYKIVDGLPENMDHYGLELARLADLPSDVMAEGRRIAEALTDLEAKREANSKSSKLTIRRRALLKLRTQLMQILDHSALPEAELLALLARIQRDTVKVLHETLN